MADWHRSPFRRPLELVSQCQAALGQHSVHQRRAGARRRWGRPGAWNSDKRMGGEHEPTPFKSSQSLVLLLESPTPSRRVAGTAGTHQGEKKGDPHSEPGVLTSMLPPPPPLLGSRPPPPPPRLQEAGAAGSLAQSHRGQAWWRGQKATTVTLQPGAQTPLCVLSCPPLCPSETSIRDSDMSALSAHPSPPLPWALLGPPGQPHRDCPWTLKMKAPRPCYHTPPTFPAG